ncbi:hypothetical protein BCR36DRAFT_375744 [Piromyces finnis]|uniref:Uncharacterized protein n=1 Tax=Piromyces finnis TaxID=1754191 RepID=A0A1Y1UEY8_9FUNG|nr:hypothetical protein BCR36DRAFT_375744 [Piromyces finnis]|eukprot:ORX36549.1 hypothetical protein BCR36DRAFT_375744 [Piromyces finnis]
MYYFDSLYKINRSIWRTYLRLIRTIINSKFGSSMNDIFIKRVLGYFISQKLTYMTLPDRYKTHPKDWYEKVNMTYMFWLLEDHRNCLPNVCWWWCHYDIEFKFFFTWYFIFKVFKRLDEYYYNAPSFVDIKDRIYNQTSYLRIVYYRIHFDSNGDDNDIYNSLHNNANTNRINNKSECIGGENGNIKFDVENIDNKNDNFNTTMNTDDKNIEAILPWNKENFNYGRDV